MKKELAELLKKCELKEMPKGWKITQGATTQPVGYVWVDNGKSLFDGYEHGLIKEQNNVRND